MCKIYDIYVHWVIKKRERYHKQIHTDRHEQFIHRVASQLKTNYVYTTSRTMGGVIFQKRKHLVKIPKQWRGWKKTKSPNQNFWKPSYEW